MIAIFDYIIIGSYLVFMLVIGLGFRRMSKDTSNYFRAGGAMPWWLTGASATNTVGAGGGHHLRSPQRTRFNAPILIFSATRVLTKAIGLQ